MSNVHNEMKQKAILGEKTYAIRPTAIRPMR